ARIDNLAAAVRSINALAEPVDAVVHTGDISHDASASDYAAARAELAKLRAPLYTTIGNRDRRNTYFDAFGGDGYLDVACGYAQYAVDLGPLHLVAVDTQYRDTQKGGLGGFCASRAAHLDALLAAGGGKPTLVFAHHPPVELVDTPRLQFREAEEAQLLCSCLQRHDALVGVLAGHVHRTFKVPIGRTELSTVPSIAVDLSREKSGESRVECPIYHVHDVANGAVVTRAIMI
ncbi:MAG: metallophosphoesterase, partial [Hyphomicrobiaceae bacterium]